MNKLVSASLIGGIFGLGIAVSGMINPAKVLN
ncbi:MAG: YeeE/YedE family protein, partial [Mesorhizobium sp.]